MYELLITNNKKFHVHDNNIIAIAFIIIIIMCTVFMLIECRLKTKYVTFT